MSYAEQQGRFSFPGAAGDGTLSYQQAFAVFDAQTGNLLVYGGLLAPTTPTTPTPTPGVGSTPTATLGLPPQLSVSPSGTTEVNCGTLPIPYPTVSVRNSGGGILHWQVTASNAQVSVSPASGSVGGGQAQTLSVSQTSGGGGTDLHVTSDGGSVTIAFVCSVG